MKKIVFSILMIAVMAVSCNKPEEQKKPDPKLPEYIDPEKPLKIGSFNVLTNSEDSSYGTFKWSLRKDYLVQAFIDLDYDICALAEYSATISKYIPAPIAAKTPRKYRWWKLSDNNPNVNSLGIVYDVNRFTMSNEKYFWLSETPDEPSHGWGETAYWRTAMMGTLTDKATGKKFIFVATHLALNDEARDNSAAVILSKIKAYNTEKLPVIMGGDMNGLCTDKYAQEFTAEYFKDAFLALDSSKKGGTVATFNNKKNNANMTLASQRIDQIYVHGNIDLQYYCADNRQYDGQYPSDHIPLYILAKF